MKRPFHSTSPPSSPFSNSEISDEFEPVPKRPRIFISSPTPPPETDDQVHSIDDDEEEEEDEIIIDELIIPSVTITEDSQSEEEEEDDDIIEIEQPNDNTVIIVSDSDFEDNDIEDDDDQGIDVTDDILPPSISRLMDASISSTDIDDIEIVQEIQEEFTLMEQEEEEFANNEEDNESLEIVTNDDNNNDELIDLTDDEPIPPCSISIPVERKLSIDVQQCPICLETLSDLQCTGVYLTITRCRHVMCTLCSRQLLATSSRCPLCRENVSSTTLMPYCILT